MCDMAGGKSLSADHDSGAGADSERGRRATFDRKSGEVHGSGSGAGGEGNPGEDYDKDPMAGAGAEPLKGPRPAAQSASRPIHPDEGV
jgi:hypothetical protein